MALFGGVTRFLDKYLFGYALGTAAGPSLAPFVQSLANAAWSENQVLPVEYALLAKGVAEGKIDHGWAAGQAAAQGISGDAFDRVVAAAKAGPGTALALQMWRRGIINDAAFGAALRDDGIRDEWITDIGRLHDVLLSPEVLANARQQGFVSDTDQVTLSGRQGITPDNANVLFELAGNPPGPMDGLTMLRRGIIDEATYRRIVAEGRTKTKYTDAFLGLRDQILSATQWATAWLKGHATEAEAKAGGLAQGYGPAEMELLYLNQGRPATTRQVHIGYARGGRLPGAANEREAFHKSIVQSNLRPEYEDVLWAQRETLPSAFVLRQLTTSGDITRDDAEKYLLWSGWPAPLAAQVADAWGGTTSAGPGTKWADRARSRVFTEAWNDYLDPDADEAAFREALAAVGVPAAEANTVVTLAQRSRGLSRRELTQAQVLKLYRRVVWTRDQAQAWLEDAGMTPEDASALLDTVGPS